jgi:hypothetical protein
VFNGLVRWQRCLPVLATSVVLLTGCGVAGTGFHPGIAAEVGDDTITTKHVDQVTDDYCTAVEKVSEGQSEEQQAQPMGYLTHEFANDLIIGSAAKQLAESYDVEPSADYTSGLAQLEPQLDELSDQQHDAVVEILGARAYAQDVLTTIGGIELGKQDNDSATDQDKYAAGMDVLNTWIADHDVVVNPKYSLELGTATEVDTDLSYALGKTAKAGQLGPANSNNPDPKLDPLRADYAAALPDHLVCLE